METYIDPNRNWTPPDHTNDVPKQPYTFLDGAYFDQQGNEIRKRLFTRWDGSQYIAFDPEEVRTENLVATLDNGGKRNLTRYSDGRPDELGAWITPPHGYILKFGTPMPYATPEERWRTDGGEHEVNPNSVTVRFIRELNAEIERLTAEVERLTAENNELKNKSGLLGFLKK